jgi:ABC-type transport system involved in cytochrome c biogenesis permease component
MSYLTVVALMLLVVSPVLIPLLITGVHVLDSLRQKNKPFRLKISRSVALEQ